MELIEQEELMIRVGKKVPESTNWNYTRGFKDAILRVRSMIHSAPTIDPVKAAGGCRCGECRHRNEHGHCAHPRHEILPTTYPNDFCSYGEPREAQDDAET